MNGFRTCHFLDVPPDKNGRVVPRKDHAYLCTVEVPEPVLPTSMTEGSMALRWPPHKSYM